MTSLRLSGWAGLHLSQPGCSRRRENSNRWRLARTRKSEPRNSTLMKMETSTVRPFALGMRGLDRSPILKHLRRLWELVVSCWIRTSMSTTRSWPTDSFLLRFPGSPTLSSLVRFSTNSLHLFHYSVTEVSRTATSLFIIVHRTPFSSIVVGIYLVFLVDDHSLRISSGTLHHPHPSHQYHTINQPTTCILQQ